MNAAAKLSPPPPIQDVLTPPQFSLAGARLMLSLIKLPEPLELARVDAVAQDLV